MKTTLNKIREHKPCTSGWTKLLGSLGKSSADDESLDLMTILESNGIEDALWCLRCFDYRDYCLFLADVAESVLPIYEEKCTNNPVPRNCIDAIRQYHAGDITIKQLKTYAAAAADAYAAAVHAAAYAAYADAAAAAYAAADAAAYAAYAAAAADAAAAYAAAAAARKQKWQEIEELFTKYFGENEIKTIKLASHIRIDQIVNWLKKDCSIEIHGFNIFIVTDNNTIINVINEANRK